MNSMACPPSRTCSRTPLDQELGRASLEWVPGPSLVSWLADPCLGPRRQSLPLWGLGHVDTQEAHLGFWASPPLSSPHDRAASLVNSGSVR